MLLRQRACTTGSWCQEKAQDGKNIPTPKYACDVCRKCRKLLCRSCFWSVHDHRQRGVHDFVYLRWYVTKCSHNITLCNPRRPRYVCILDYLCVQSIKLCVYGVCVWFQLQILLTTDVLFIFMFISGTCFLWCMYTYMKPLWYINTNF